MADKARTIEGLFSDLYIAEFDYRHATEEIAAVYRSLGAEPPALDREKALEALQKARNAILARGWDEGANAGGLREAIRDFTKPLTNPYREEA